jgi:hypothetical protein
MLPPHLTAYQSLHRHSLIVMQPTGHNPHFGEVPGPFFHVNVPPGQGEMLLQLPRIRQASSRHTMAATKR